MFIRIFNTLCLLTLWSTSVFSATGNLFIVTSSGTALPEAVSLTLCLNVNGRNPLSCQNYTTQYATLSIKTTIPNRTYHYAGIKINTPGYAYSILVSSNGYSLLGTISDTQSATGNINTSATITITPSAGANGSISPTSAQTVAYGGNVTFTATPNSGYSISEWTLDGSAYAACGTNATCVLTNVTSDHTIAVTFNVVLSATVSPNSLSVDSGQTATFTANPTGGISPYSYQWYSCTDSTCTSATAILDATSSTYSPSTATTGTYYYQAVVMDSAPIPETATANVATLTIDGALSATVSPSSLSVYTNETANFTANPTGGTSPYSYQWYLCTDSSCGAPTIISEATSGTYSPSTATIGTYYYQAVVTDSASSPETATTNVATLTVSSLPHIIFVTTNTYQGNLEGFSGANTNCNSASSGKPSSGFASDYTYKALLNGNSATVSGTKYYRTDGTTLIATATGGNLVGSSSLMNSISTSSSPTVWTGANVNNCSNWTSTTTSGDRGDPSKATSQYWSTGNSSCSIARALYCASQ